MVITRFAPSPTGDLHVGSARTALYAYLFAKHHQGQFLLRIEDTDQERSTKAAVDVIFEGLRWLGIEWDKPPVYQTENVRRYHEVAAALLKAGHAYRCYLSKEALDAMREAQIARNEKPRYNGYSRDLNLPDTGESHVIRFKNPLTGTVSFVDEILGLIRIDNAELDDFILIRSDGLPTYNFAVVVDDADMSMTHVIRGNDHLNNTVRQLNVYEALGWVAPKFAHIPMIAGEDGKKLSKRHGAVSVLQYREAGYLPHALLNYLVRLGWSHGNQEIFTRQEMIDYFNLNTVSKSPAIFDNEKLNWLNQQHIRSIAWDNVAAEVAWHYQRVGIDTRHGPDLQKVFNAYRERIVTLDDLVKKTRCYYEDELVPDPAAATAWLTLNSLPILNRLMELLVADSDWELSKLKAMIAQVVQEFHVKLPAVGQPLRVVLTGDTQSPGIDQTLVLVGKVRSLLRLDSAIRWIQEQNHCIT